MDDKVNYIGPEPQRGPAAPGQGAPGYTAPGQVPPGQGTPGYAAAGQAPPPRVTYAGPAPRKRGGWKKGLLIFGILLVILILLGIIAGVPLGKEETTGGQKISDSGRLSMSSAYIGELYVSGEIGAATGSIFGDSGTGYHHQWTMDRIDDMIDDGNNKGILMYMDTPGGSVYETDELYLKLKEYREKTGRPVYTYMADQAASGGYYISCASDRIFANRNCWTGSIGVIVGPIYDVKDLMDKYGVKAVTITSGKNKGMGSMTEHMTKEQKEILQSLVDEAYDQFVDCVVEGRKMDEEKVRKLADGRIYTARQAKENGLIDQIGSLEDTLADMRKVPGLHGVELTPILYDPDLTMMDKLLYSASSLVKSKADTDLSILKQMMEEGQQTTVAYLSTVQK